MGAEVSKKPIKIEVENGTSSLVAIKYDWIGNNHEPPIFRELLNWGSVGIQGFDVPDFVQCEEMHNNIDMFLATKRLDGKGQKMTMIRINNCHLNCGRDVYDYAHCFERDHYKFEVHDNGVFLTSDNLNYQWRWKVVNRYHERREKTEAAKLIRFDHDFDRFVDTCM